MSPEPTRQSVPTGSPMQRRPPAQLGEEKPAGEIPYAQSNQNDAPVKPEPTWSESSSARLAVTGKILLRHLGIHPSGLQDTPEAAKFRAALWTKASLDPLTSRLSENFEHAVRDDKATPAQLAILLGSIADHPQSRVSPVLVNALIEMGEKNPAVLFSAAKLFTARPDLRPPFGFAAQCWNANNPETTAAALRMLANRNDLAVSPETLQEALTAWTKLPEPKSSDGDPLQVFMRHRLLNGSSPSGSPRPGDSSDKGLVSPESPRRTMLCSSSSHAYQVAAAALEVYEKRSSIQAPDSLLPRIAALSERLGQRSNPSCLDLNIAEMLQAEEAKAEFNRQAYATVASRFPTRYCEFARKFENSDPVAGAEFASNILGRPAVRQNYSYADLPEDRLRLAAVAAPGSAGAIDRAFSKILVEKLLLDPKNKLSREQLEDIALPTLNVLSDMARGSPELWGRYAASPPATLEAAVRITAANLHAERERFLEANPTIFGEGITLRPICHVGTECAPGPVIALGKRYKMDVLPPIVGDKDQLRCEIRKQEALLSTGEAVKDKSRPQTLYFNAHGGPSHMWLSDGEIGRETNDDLDVAGAISYRELAQTFVGGQQPAGMKADEVNFSHVCVVFDSCIAGDYARRFLDELAQSAEQRGMKVTGYPLVVAGAQRGSLGYISPLERQSFLQVAFSRYSGNSESFDSQDLLKVDRLLKRLTGAGDNSLRELARVQDMAIFSPLRHQAGSMTVEVAEQLEREGYLIAEQPTPKPVEVETKTQKERMTEMFLQKHFGTPDPKKPPPAQPRRAFDNNEISSLILPPVLGKRESRA